MTFAVDMLVCGSSFQTRIFCRANSTCSSTFSSSRAEQSAGLPPDPRRVVMPLREDEYSCSITRAQISAPTPAHWYGINLLLLLSAQSDDDHLGRRNGRLGSTRLAGSCSPCLHDVFLSGVRSDAAMPVRSQLDRIGDLRDDRRAAALLRRLSSPERSFPGSCGVRWCC